jgi:protein phosphatase 1 regulatory subunit 7
VQKLCLRQNSIHTVEGLDRLGSTLKDLDLYDNAIAHIKGLDELLNLTSVDLSFNKIKHIKNVKHLKQVKDLYFVQNKIVKIEELDGMTALRNLELAANRIRVGGVDQGCGGVLLTFNRRLRTSRVSQHWKSFG